MKPAAALSMRAWKEETFGSDTTTSLFLWRPRVVESRVNGKEVSAPSFTSTSRLRVGAPAYWMALGVTTSWVSSSMRFALEEEAGLNSTEKGAGCGTFLLRSATTSA